MKTGKILDPIHGLIEITEIEEFIINEPIFGRLRKVKQNTLLNLIFPGANHTRFEHSIGVMHLSEIIFNKSNENVETIYLKNQKYSKNEEYISIKDLFKSDLLGYNILVQELRIAALLHDVGHGPTSHKFDDFTINGNRLFSILDTEQEIFSDYIEAFNSYINNNRIGDKKIEHELVSIVFIIKILKTLKKQENFTKESRAIIEGINIDNIIKMIDPQFLHNKEIIIHDKNYTDYFNSIIASFPFDADRMDYLYRDSFYSGVKYGFFDQSRILMSLLPVELKGRFTLGIKKSGLDSVVRFIQSRNHLYNQVYFHKTNSATNAMLDFIFRHMEDETVLDEVISYKDYEKFYIKNGDEFFFNSTLKRKLEQNGCFACGDSCPENDVLDELLDRKLFKRIYENRVNVKDPASTNNFKDLKFNENKLIEIKAKLEKEDIFIQESYSINLGLKGFNKSKSVIIDKDLDGKINIRKDWDNLTDEMNFLSQTNVFLKRIYLRRTFKNAEELNKIQQRVLELFKQYSLL